MSLIRRVSIALMIAAVFACAASATMAQNILITDINNNGTPHQFDVHQVNVQTGAVSVFTTLTAYSGGIAYNPVDGKVYVSEFSGKIWSFNTDGTGKTLFFTPGGYYYQTSLAVMNGVLYGGDSVRQKVYKYSSAGVESEFSTTIMGRPEDGFTHFDALTAGPDGNLYAGVYENDTVYRVRPDGTVETWLTNQHYPAGIAFDSAANLYVTQQGLVYGGLYNKVREFSPTGAPIPPEDNTYISVNFYDTPANILFGPGDEHFYELGQGGLLVEYTNGSGRNVLYNNPAGYFLDMTLVPVPEPTGLITLLFGGIALVGGLRRRC